MFDQNRKPIRFSLTCISYLILVHVLSFSMTSSPHFPIPSLPSSTHHGILSYNGMGWLVSIACTLSSSWQPDISSLPYLSVPLSRRSYFWLHRCTCPYTTGQPPKLYFIPHLYWDHIIPSVPFVPPHFSVQTSTVPEVLLSSFLYPWSTPTYTHLPLPHLPPCLLSR